MHNMAFLITAILLMISQHPTVALAAFDDAPITIPENLTEREKRILFRVCSRADDRSRIRCFVRQLEKMGYDGNRTLPTGAYEVYTELDQTRVRSQQNAKQTIQDRITERLKDRRTFGNFVPTVDINTQRLDYVNVIRLERLRCMRDVAPGRPRALCLDQLNSDAKQYYNDYADEKATKLMQQ